MPDSWSRRTLLQAGGIVTLTALPGCHQLRLGPTPTPGPDAGTESYGLVVRNESNFKADLVIEVSPPFQDGGIVFEERVNGMERGDEEYWAGVVTATRDDGELIKYAIQVEFRSNGNQMANANYFVTPGSDSAPDTENIGAVIEQNEDGLPKIRMGPDVS